jgi:hypothetical protein
MQTVYKQCTNVVNETISYYNFNKTNVHLLLLDASKAFDRVKYCKLFQELLNRNVLPVILILLSVMYINKKLQVKWKSKTCEGFSVLNGVKQAGVLSPILFAVYVDGLLQKLENSGVGCYVGYKFVGAIAYADDLILLAPTVTALRKLITICEMYAAEYDIKFNGSKSRYMVYKGRECTVYNTDIYVNCDKVECVTSADHLGHRLSTVDKNSMVNTAISHFWRSFNLFMANFGHSYALVKNQLFKQYCCSYYGAPLWSINDCQNICVAWRKALRIIWNVPSQTHNRIIALLSGSAPLFTQLKARFLKFISKAIEHPNSTISHVSKHACRNPMSVCGRNWRDIVCVNSVIGMSVNDIYNDWYETLCNEEIDSVSVLKEMIDIREGRGTCDVFNIDDALYIINDLCIN